MIKKILAVAIVSAFAAPAFAATANVDVYGTLNMSVDRVDGDSADGARNRVSSNNSNFGFKGNEDLGGGLSAVWQFEQAISMENGGLGNASNTDLLGTVGQRNTFAGLSSKALGALTLGNQESPMKTSIGSLDLFGNTIADYRTLMGPQTRGANSILYTSPKFSGLDVKLMHSARNEDGKTDDAAYWSGNVTYTNGPFFAALAHEQENIQVTALAGAQGIGTATDVVNVAAAKTEQTTTRVGFGYSFGDAKVGLGYNKTEIDNILTASSGRESATWLLSGAYKMGNATLKAQYLKQGDAKSPTATVANSGSNQFTIGADYALSKRTGLYALYTKLSNDSASSNKLGNNSGVVGGNTGIATVSTASTSALPAAGNGQDPTAFAIGMIHKF